MAAHPAGIMYDIDYQTFPYEPVTSRPLLLKPALEAVGLPASRPATKDAAATHGVRLHDLRQTFAVLQLSAGTHFMQVSKWLGHSAFTLTLDVYGDYIPEQDGGAANTPARATRAGTPR